MKVYRTEDTETLSAQEREWIYNAHDAMLTREVDDVLEEYMTDTTRRTYAFCLRQLRPAFVMMRRGIKVELEARAVMAVEVSKQKAAMEAWLNQLADAVWDGPLNGRSWQQLQNFFYGVMKVPPITMNFKGVKRVTTNREALEKIYNNHPDTRPIINTILAVRDLTKTLNVLETKIRDGRFYTSFNPVGTKSDRWSSRTEFLGSGSNIQNITLRLREIFIPDPGMVLGYTDLEQAEARGVAFLSCDEAYIDACLSEDLHTAVSRYIWQELPWNGDLKKDRAIADRIFYRQFTFRDMAKRAAHASNYYAKPWTIARYLKIEQKVAEEFQDRYFGIFPGIRRWQSEVAQQLMLTRTLTTPFGRVRQFYGRPNDDATIRKAIAHLPQSTIAYYLDEGLCVLAENNDPQDVQLLAQVHDAILWQSHDPYKARDTIHEALYQEVKFPAGSYAIPAETKIGPNWKALKKI